MRTLILAATLAATGTLSAGVTPVVPRLPEDFLAKLRPAPKPDAPAAEETPAAIAERIVAQGKKAGDRLQQKDSGTFTQKTQQDILTDIDKLLKPPPPPPMSESSDDPPPPMGGGGGGGMPPPTGGSKPPPKGGSGDSPSSRGQARKEQREREQGGKPPADPGPPMPATPMPGDKPGGKPMPGDKGGDKPTPGESGEGPGKPPPKPALPPDDAVTKQIWGHLPDRLRQEMNQYYKEQFMPKYNDMLRQYYSRLAERDKGGKK